MAILNRLMAILNRLMAVLNRLMAVLNLSFEYNSRITLIDFKLSSIGTKGYNNPRLFVVYIIRYSIII